MKILRIEFDNLPHFRNGTFAIDFMATNRVISDSGLFHVSGNIRTNNTIVFIGLNATGKTTVLRLLRAAMRIVIDNEDLNHVLPANGMVKDGTIMRVLFFHRNAYHMLESVIGIVSKKGSKSYAYYKEETLAQKSKSHVRSKADLCNFMESASSIQKRSELDESVMSYMQDSRSIVVSVSKENESMVSEFLDLNHVNLFPTIGETPNEILDVFDDSIDTLIAEPQGSIMHCKVRFKNDKTEYDTVDMLALNQIISAGTIKGQGLISLAILALQKGGYLLVDELEAHLNKKLVQVIIELFKDKRTNPNGACLMFSTHYIEILDFIDRKDNIYVTRKNAGLLSASKYADEFKRNDFKKSDVILSNALKGTAPSYEKIQRMRDAICAVL